MIRALLVGLLLLTGSAGAAWAEDPTAICAHLGTDDTQRPLPPSLVAAATKAFGYSGMTPDQVEHGTVYRCMNARVLMCAFGANLPCGKADTRRSPPAATSWCATNPESDFIPAYVTGHDSIYQWSCHNGRAVVANPAALDPRGFFKRYWALAPR